MNLIFLDTETTGIKDGRLVQLAMRHKGENIDWMFKPPVPIDFEAMAVHHITEKMVAGLAPFAEPDREKVRAILGAGIAVIHNAPFDLGVLGREGVLVARYIDTLKVARRLWAEWPSHKLQVIRYRLGIEIEAGMAHNALADVLVLEKVFEAMMTYMTHKDVDHGTTPEQAVELMMDWSTKPSLLHSVGFGKHKGRTWEDVAKTDRSYLTWVMGEKFDADVMHTAGHWLNQTMNR